MEWLHGTFRKPIGAAEETSSATVPAPTTLPSDPTPVLGSPSGKTHMTAALPQADKYNRDRDRLRRRKADHGGVTCRPRLIDGKVGVHSHELWPQGRLLFFHGPSRSHWPLFLADLDLHL